MSPVWSQCQWLHMTPSTFWSSTPPSRRISLIVLATLRPGIPFLIEPWAAGAWFHQSFLQPRSNMKVLPCFLFFTRKAKVGMFMVSWPFWTGCTNAPAGTTISVVVFIMCTSTQLSPLGRLREGAASGLMSCSAIVSDIYPEYSFLQWKL